jgi:4-carboxymuconolactone decarboxylase
MKSSVLFAPRSDWAPPMDERTRALVELSTALASGTRGAWRSAMSTALERALPIEVEETILQSYLFLGYPLALQALAVLRELLPESASTEERMEIDTWRERGAAVCATVYGGQYDKLRANVQRLHPDVEQWMLTEGYGKVLARPGLDLKTRELCIIALLAAQDAQQQLHSHLRGALNAGASLAEVEDAVTTACVALPRERAQQARALWGEVRGRWLGRGAGA